MPGCFITIEGVDGAGKSTQVDLLAKRLTSLGHTVRCTQEPGGTRLGEAIRQMLLDARNQEMSERTEVLLYAAARAQHVREVILPAIAAGEDQVQLRGVTRGVILPAIAAGEVVICSRFTDSTVAYQGYGSGIDLGLIRTINAAATGGLAPDLTLLFDLDPEQGLGRVRQRAAGDDRIEQRELNYHRRVRAGFLQIAAAEPKRVKIIRADRPPDAVQAAVAGAVDEFLGTGNERG